MKTSKHEPKHHPKRDRIRRGDHRHVLAKRRRPKLPAKVDLRRKAPAARWPVWDQTPLLSCTAHAVAGAALFAMIDAERGPVFQPSRLFLYHCEQVLAKHDHQNIPGTVRYAMEILQTRGMCPDAPTAGAPVGAVWPYSGDYTTKPKAACFKFAAKHRMAHEKYYLTNELAHLRGCLAEGHPFTICVGVYPSNNGVCDVNTPLAKTGVIPMPTDAERAGCASYYHAMLIVGYDDKSQVFIVRNSMGTNWGKGGHGTIPYAYILDPALTDSFWTLRLPGE